MESQTRNSLLIMKTKARRLLCLKKSTSKGARILDSEIKKTIMIKGEIDRQLKTTENKNHSPGTQGHRKAHDRNKIKIRRSSETLNS